MTNEAPKLVRGNRYNFRSQPERLIYLGARFYPGDRRTWHQFALVDKPAEVWSELLPSDLHLIEETA